MRQEIPDQDQNEILSRLFTVAGEQIIEAIGKHAKNPRQLAERLAKWLFEVLK